MTLRSFALPLIAALVATAAVAQEMPPVHTEGSPLFGGASPELVQALADGGVSIERGMTPARRLAEHRRLEASLAALKPQRPGVVDAYVLTIALDSDPVFAREAREAGRVLAARYDAAGRALTLAGADGKGGPALAMGSPAAIDAALARIAELMDRSEDVLVLYTTSHGAPLGLAYNDGDQGYGAISPTRLWTVLSELGIGNRLLLVSACYSGVFVPMLQSDTTAIVTASSADRSSFGCQAENDWTFFGDALVNRALRKRQPLATAAAEAQATIAGWERREKLDASRPQVAIGAGATRWLAALEARMPATNGAPVGRPAVEEAR
jgi:hypothetical protein